MSINIEKHSILGHGIAFCKAIHSLTQYYWYTNKYPLFYNWAQKFAIFQQEILKHWNISTNESPVVI